MNFALQNVLHYSSTYRIFAHSEDLKTLTYTFTTLVVAHVLVCVILKWLDSNHYNQPYQNYSIEYLLQY